VRPRSSELVAFLFRPAPRRTGPCRRSEMSLHRPLDVRRRVEEQDHVREVPPPVRDARTVLGLVARFEGPEIGRDGKDARGLLEEVRLGSGRPSLLLRAWRADKLIPRTPAATLRRRTSRQSIAVRLAETESQLRANDSASSRSLQSSASSSRSVQPRRTARCCWCNSLPPDDADLPLSPNDRSLIAPTAQRFEITNQAHKIDTPIRYPLQLDMGPYLTDHLEYPASYKP
jgi:hypothetical protein